MYVWLGVALYDSNIDVNGNKIGNLSFLCRFRSIRYGQFDLNYFRPSGASVRLFHHLSAGCPSAAVFADRAHSGSTAFGVYASIGFVR